MNVVTLDCETTTSNKGNPFDQTNKLCAVGLREEPGEKVSALKVEYDADPYGETLTNINTALGNSSLLVLFNGKFDLNWLYLYGITYKGRVWDCQFFEYLDSLQTWAYPSLAESCQRRGIAGEKCEDIVTQYWDQGVDTPQIPWEVIERRVLGDVDLTWKLYLAQKERFETWSLPRRNLFRLHCDDLKVLQEIERNGFYYDETQAQVEAQNTKTLLLNLRKEIYELIGSTVPNLGSDEHLSAVLYGGVIRHKYQLEIGTFKTGQKAGLPKFKWMVEEHIFERLVNPLDGSQSKEKDTVWSVDKRVLGRLLWRRLNKRTRRLVELIIQYSKENRKLSSDLEGLPKLITKMNWPRNMLQGNINQCVTRTGRTSSSKPNLQNFDGELKYLFRSRYATTP